MTLFGQEIFAGLVLWQVSLLASVYALAFLVKGVFGYGAVPILIVAGSAVLEPHHAVVLAAATNLVTHGQYLPDGLRHGDRGLVLRSAVYLVPAIAVGVWVFSRMTGGSLGVLTGLIILLSILADARGWLAPLEPWVRAHTGIAGPVFGITAGLISGIVGAGAIAFISLYIRMFAPERDRFRATIILVTGVILAWRSAALAWAGALTPTVLAEALALLPAALLAGWAGGRFGRRLKDDTFFRAYRGVLCLGAGLMILRGLAG